MMPGGLQAEHDLSLDGVSAPVDGGDGPGPDDPAVPAEVLLRSAAVRGCGSPGPNTRYASGFGGSRWLGGYRGEGWVSDPFRHFSIPRPRVVLHRLAFG